MQKRLEATPLDKDRKDEMLSVVEVDLGEEQHSYTCRDQGVFQQIQAEISGTETSQEQTSMIQEYVLLLCRFEAITMQDYERFCLLKLSSSQHKLLVGISFKLGIRVSNTSFLWTDGNFLEKTCIKFLTISTLLLLLLFLFRV